MCESRTVKVIEETEAGNKKQTCKTWISLQLSNGKHSEKETSQLETKKKRSKWNTKFTLIVKE